MSVLCYPERQYYNFPSLSLALSVLLGREGKSESRVFFVSKHVSDSGNNEEYLRFYCWSFNLDVNLHIALTAKESTECPREMTIFDVSRCRRAYIKPHIGGTCYENTERLYSIWHSRNLEHWKGTGCINSWSPSSLPHAQKRGPGGAEDR